MVANESPQWVSKSGYMLRLEAKTQFYHPTEIILWKYGYYYLQTGDVSAAIKYYERASDICFISTNLTLNIIGIGIEFEKYSIILREKKKEYTKYSKNLIKKWSKINNTNNSDILKEVFGEVNLKSIDPQYFFCLGRKITY